MQTTAAIFGPVISSYSRAQEIEDGELFDVPEETSREAGFRVPVAMTSAVFEDCVNWSDADDKRKRTMQDVQGRLWDVLHMARLAIRRSNGGRRVTFGMVRVPRDGRGRTPKPVNLVVACGPGDAGEPVITIMQPHED